MPVAEANQLGTGLLAPMARRIPISRVRSVTGTSMMFMIPMPPTKSDTAATLRSIPVCASAAISWVAARSARFRDRPLADGKAVRGGTVDRGEPVLVIDHHLHDLQRHLLPMPD